MVSSYTVSFMTFTYHGCPLVSGLFYSFRFVFSIPERSRGNGHGDGQRCENGRVSKCSVAPRRHIDNPQAEAFQATASATGTITTLYSNSGGHPDTLLGSGHFHLSPRKSTAIAR